MICSGSVNLKETKWLIWINFSLDERWWVCSPTQGQCLHNAVMQQLLLHFTSNLPTFLPSPFTTDNCRGARQRAVYSPLVQNESSRLSRVSVHAHAQNCSLLWRTHIHHKPFGNHYNDYRWFHACMCVYRQAPGLMMRAVTGTTPGASYWLPVQLSQRECWRRLHELQSGVDGGAERQTVRSLRDYGGRWILCFLAVTPTGFINSLVKRGKARHGSSAFLVKVHRWMFYVMAICILTAGLRWSLFSLLGPTEGKLASCLFLKKIIWLF